jgi:hypothetical protein
MAATAADQPSLYVPAGSPSPVYVLALALWMRAAGITLASAVMFNAACYMVAALALVAMLRDRAPRLGTLALVSFSFSPALLLTSTQVLKDAFFAMLIVAACVAVLTIVRYSRHSLSERPNQMMLGIFVGSMSIAAIGGVRAYYAIFIWIGAAAGLFASLAAMRRSRWLPFGGFAATILVVLWCAFAVGADAYYDYYRDLIARTTGVNLTLPAVTWRDGTRLVGSGDVGELGSTLNRVRMGFIGSGGATNITSRAGFQLTTQGVRQVLADLAVGLAAMFIPISLLRATSIVSFDGGRGLLAITDLDTIFLDLTLIAVAVVMVQARPVGRYNIALIVFVVTLAVIAAVVVAYVVTNFGTLFRLRLLAAVPAWLVPLALAIDQPSRVPSRLQDGHTDKRSVAGRTAHTSSGFEI